MKNTSPRSWLATAALVALAIPGALVAPATAAGPLAAQSSAATTATLTNLAHLDFLLDTVSPERTTRHTTYRLAAQPELTMPWTYADARDGGTFERVGGGPLDPATGHWGQGAYNADDVSRAAVVYLRAWTQNGDTDARQKAYELLRSLAYLQTATGPNAGNVVLWMQPDGELNPSPVPVELPNPSDSGDSYWLARSLWAFGEGYAAFRKADPQFAGFLRDRMRLGISAVNREALSKYGQYRVADGVRVPAWLIVDGADASAEAVLGLAAYSAAAPGDRAARRALDRLSEGIAAMGTRDRTAWPYGAILPWAQSRTMWHAWSSQMPAALAEASVVLGNRSLLAPALRDSTSFTPTLLTAGGPDNAWYPTPIERVQIAYGADSRLQSLLAVADATKAPGLRQLAGMMGAWYFGNNASGQPVYDPATGVTFDGVQADGTVNRNSGAESTIHGLLSMLALDAHPSVSARAQAVTHASSRSGLAVVEAETANPTTGIMVTPESPWTGESQFGGGAWLRLDAGDTATIAVPESRQARTVEPVLFLRAGGSARSTWSWNSSGTATGSLGRIDGTVGRRGITAVDGALLPQTLRRQLPAEASSVSVLADRGRARVDGVILRPVVSSLVLAGSGDSCTALLHSTSGDAERAEVGAPGKASVVSVYDARGRLVSERTISGQRTVLVPATGFVIVTR